MFKVFKKKPIKILMILISIISIGNILITLPTELNKRSLYDDITEDVILLNEIGIETNISIDVRYKFNLITSKRELNLLNDISFNLNEVIKTEAIKLQISLSILKNDLISLEKQLLILNLTEDIYDKRIIDKALEYSLDNTNTLRDDTKEIYTEIINGNKALEAYKKRINDFKQTEIIAGRFSNELWDKTDSEILDIIKNMDNREKAGQLIMLGIVGQTLDDDDRSFLQKIRPSGIILMGYNIGNEQQTKDLTKSIQSIGDIPFFIATDQEGGPVKRIWWDDTSGASAWDEMSDEDVCTLGEDRSKLLRSLGINVNFAPVVDLSYYSSGFINHRTISNDPLVVSTKASQFINCSQQNGVFTALKHFPGHGATNEDSHYTLPIISKSKEEWLNSDAIPFYENLDSKFIMIGHLNFRNIDDRPATLSNLIMKDIIRDEFSYKGILVSDDMNQLERSTDIDTKDAVIGSLNAGMDIVLYVGNPVSPNEMIDVISNAIKNGEISDVDNKLERILKTKREIY